MISGLADGALPESEFLESGDRPERRCTESDHTTRWAYMDVRTE
jgi:hypothetical protein